MSPAQGFMVIGMSIGKYSAKVQNSAAEAVHTNVWSPHK